MVVSTGAHWYIWMFLGFGMVMFFPVEFLTEIGSRTGWSIGWQQVIWLEFILIGGTVVAMMLLKRAYPELHWYEPLGGLAVAGLMRGVMRFVDK